MTTFDNYCLSKKIDPIAFQANDPTLWHRLKLVFDQVSETSFTQQKLFLINDIRRRFQYQGEYKTPLKVEKEAVANDAISSELPKTIQPKSIKIPGAQPNTSLVTEELSSDKPVRKQPMGIKIPSSKPKEEVVNQDQTINEQLVARPQPPKIKIPVPSSSNKPTIDEVSNSETAPRPQPPKIKIPVPKPKEDVNNEAPEVVNEVVARPQPPKIKIPVPSNKPTIDEVSNSETAPRPQPPKIKIPVPTIKKPTVDLTEDSNPQE